MSNRRNEFVEKYGINGNKDGLENAKKPQPTKNPNKINAMNRQSPKKMNGINSKNEKKKIKRPNSGKKENYKGNIKKKIYALAVAGGVFIGGFSMLGGMFKDSGQNEPATIGEVLQNGESLEDLKINDNILSDIEEIKKILDRDDLQNTELMRISR